MSFAGDLTGELVADKYELLRLIGRGGMGAVYEARNVTTLKRCAVKVLLTPELAGDAEVVKRFFREARASGLIESEHVVAAFDSGIDSLERVYYVMERLEGEDLEQTLDKLGQLSPEVATKIALQAAMGLASAHAVGVVHRDVKPANLFLAVGVDGEIKVKVLDFGVAKVKMEVFNESTSSLTHSGSVLGTPLYMSPEQLRRAASIDESADVWSLGVVLFECLTGQVPWGHCDGIGELVTAILTQPVPRVQDLAPWVSPALAEVTQRALSRDPQRRHANAAELRDALLKLVDGETRLYARDITQLDEQQRSSRAPRLSHADTVLIGPTPRSGTPVVSSTAPQAARRRTPLTLGLGALAVAGAVVWTAARAPVAAPVGPALLAAAKPPAPAVSAPPASAAAAPVAEMVSFSLEVGPPAAQVTIDGARAPLRAGRVEIAGLVGTVKTVRVTLAGRSREDRVAITNHGLLPTKVWAPVSSHVLPVPSGQAAAAPAPLPDAPQTPPVVTSGALPNLTRDFE